MNRYEVIAKKWVGILGLGMHPDTRAKDYNPPLSKQQQIEYEQDMDALFESEDAYKYVVNEMEKIISVKKK